MSEAREGECPICGRSFPVKQLNSHANECLSSTEPLVEDVEVGDPFVSDNMSSHNAKKRKSSDLSNSGWGNIFGKRSKTGQTGSSNNNDGHKTSKNKSKQNGDIEFIKSVKNSESLSKNIPDSNLSRDEERKEMHGGTSIHSDCSSVTVSKSNTINIVDLLVQQKCISKPTFGSKKPSNKQKSTFAPLAERMRPMSIDGFVGQEQAVGPSTLLSSLFKSGIIPSLIFWGPPGCGKTTLAKIIANCCKQQNNAKFVQLSATTSGVGDVRDAVKVAKMDQSMFKRKTILFIDEIHRFNKLQQDSLLPHVEDGTVILLGATTENPSFYVNSALLSRSRVIVLEKLSVEDMEKILTRAAEAMGAEVVNSTSEEIDHTVCPAVLVEKEAITTLAKLCDGDARSALNGLQMSIQSQLASRGSRSGWRGEEGVEEESRLPMVVTVSHVKEGLQKSHILYDKTGDEHFHCVSALQKSIRGSDASAALYWMARMLEGGENPLYVARRLVRMASEDIGLADPQALPIAISAYQASHFLGMPECDAALAQCAVYLARAPKSVEVYMAYERAKQCVKNPELSVPGVPLHLRNARSKLDRELGYGKGYKHFQDDSDPVRQEYFPDCLRGTDFFT